MSSITDLTPGVWNIDPSHTIVGFSARHMMITKVRGPLHVLPGTVTIAEDPLRVHRRGRGRPDLGRHR